LGISAPALLYHLDALAAQRLILKTTIAQIGNARINEISINPPALQQIRQILGLGSAGLTLITGFGKEGNGYRIPDIALRLLEGQGYSIKRIVCFSSPDAKIIRDAHENDEYLFQLDQYHLFDYVDYRNFSSTFFQQVESLLDEEIQAADVLLDLTPLSKLFSFKLLDIATRYHLPCFYLGQNSSGEYFLMWMSQLQILGI
jgi:hypothetical protein